jgi:hypothetical protein
MRPEKDYTVPKRWGFCLGALGLCIFGILVWITDDSDKAALSAFSAGTILLAARVRWDLRGEWYYWLLLVIVSLGHAALIVLTKVSLPSPTIQLAPLVILDFSAIIAAIFAIERGINSVRLRD